MPANRFRPGRTAILAGLGVLWVSALLAVSLESGDCGGTIETCAAAEALARDHVRLIAIAVLLMSVAGVAALRMDHRTADGALSVGAAMLVAVGLWAAQAAADAPEWLPNGFVFTLPAAVLLLVGGGQRLRRPRAELDSAG